MILKKLEIQGFKSFADRTEVLFTPGVTAVVGPNGSGKSNISDAILWVLGEQNVRAIRGQKAQDVIFAGTDKRRPIGMAEVSLTVDNSSGKLPLDYAEVTVTRRAYRSGESEFFINKTACRLKDIYELFMDTGVGREAYSIVSQGEMDAILSARSEDRRSLFDEAAGIKKYRHRKKEAERRLENVQTNLNRVNDIVSELSVQIDPLAEQAKIAERYIELATRLREIEVGILVNDLHKFTTDIQRVKAENESDSVAIIDSEEILTALEEEKTALAVDLANADAQAERYGRSHQDALTHAERTESQLLLAKQRHASADVSQVRFAEEIAELERRIAQVEAQRSGIIVECEQAEAEESELAARVAERAAELASLQKNMDAAVRSADDQKSSYIELAKKLAAQRNELSNATSRIENLQSLLSRRATELKESQVASEKASTERQAAEESLVKARAELAAIVEVITDLRKLVDQKRLALRESSAKLEQQSRLLVDKLSRLKTLREMDDAKEGYFFGVRSVAAAVKSKSLKGDYAVVADVIDVPKGYETAYEVALGSSLQDIICDTDSDAKSAISHLKNSKGGRATFLPLNMMRHSASPMLRDLVGKNGVLGIGNELINFDRKYAPAIDSLLAKVVIAEDIDSAVYVSKSAMGWSKIVTLSGEIVYPSGAMTGGFATTKTVTILGRKQDITTLESDVRKLEKEIASSQKSVNEFTETLDVLSSKLSLSEKQDQSLKMSVMEKERQLEFLSRDAKRLLREMETIQAEKESIQENLRRASDAQATLTAAIESADRENIDLDSLIAQTSEQVRVIQIQYDAVGAERNAISVSIASLTQKRLGMEQSIQNAANTVRDLSTEISRKKNQLNGTAQEKQLTEDQRIELEQELAKARQICQANSTQAEHWRKTKQTILASSTEVNERVKEVSRKRDELTQRVHSAELREARLDMQITQTQTRLLEEYEITPEEAMRTEVLEVKYGSTAEVMRLRRDIKNMGEVNTGAVGEYARLTERYEFLSVQRQDLHDAKEDILKMIKDIDESTRGVFMETFDAVAKHFTIMFDRLFGGGSTQLILTNPEDILETGIDVIVELPGKKRQNLHLLSGGERALTAAALMFALMCVRPSPFCLMDEVDAPLDEANVERFADVIKDFAERSQMIVITHNKSTMEVADVLYGVTMQEPGISSIVSVKLREGVTA